jgi:hypothetical protein
VLACSLKTSFCTTFRQNLWICSKAEEGETQTHTDAHRHTQTHTDARRQQRPFSRTIRFTNKFSEQKRLGWRTVSRITNTKAGNSGKLRVSARECQLLVNFGSVHVLAWIRRAFSWISLCCVLLFNILLNKTPWDQKRVMIAKWKETLNVHKILLNEHRRFRKIFNIYYNLWGCFG